MKKDDVAVGNLFMSKNEITHSEKKRTAFDILTMPIHMDVDLVLLNHQYHQAQRLYHPDRWVGKTDFEKRKAADMAIQINQAYGILKDPRLRATEILKTQDIILPEDQEQTKQDPDLLMEMMEWQERIEECHTDHGIEAIKKGIQEALTIKQRAFEENISLETYYGFIYFLKLAERI